MKYRKLATVIEGRLAEEGPLIQVVIGPRQIGKTTALKAALDGRGVYESADYPTPLPTSVIEEWWAKAQSHSSKTLAIDEIQKIPGWTEVIKRLWDASDGTMKLVVTGSSALLVERGLHETLAGRFELIRAEHWNLSEAQKIFDRSLEEFIEYGCYPGSMQILQKGIERWGQYVRDSIVEPALGRDLLQLHPVDHPSLLRQIFGVAVAMPCQIVSLQKMQGQLQGKGTLPTIQTYLKLLGGAYLVSCVEKYSPVPIRTKKSSPKLIVHDNGLIRAFERPIAQGLAKERYGRYVENAVGARLIESGWDIFYWKQRDLEVDFAAIGPDGDKLAIEVKSSRTTEKDLRGLKRFCEIYPDFKPCLASLVGQEIKGIRTIPIEELLSFHRNY